jgi:hypothetical protein
MVLRQIAWKGYLYRIKLIRKGRRMGRREKGKMDKEKYRGMISSYI